MVEKKYEHFIKKYYSTFQDVLDGFYTREFECSDREVFGVKQEEGMFGFSFYSVGKIYTDNGSCSGAPTNYSEMYYFGKRYSYDELIKLQRFSDAKFLKERDVTEGIFCDNGSIVVDIFDSSKTVDEYKRENSLKFFEFLEVNKLDFLEGLATVIDMFEDDVMYAIEIKGFPKKAKEQAKFFINVNGSNVFETNLKTISKDNIIEAVKFSDVLLMIDDLCDKFPYLAFIVDNAANMMLENDSLNIGEALITVASNMDSRAEEIDHNKVLVKQGEKGVTAGDIK